MALLVVIRRKLDKLSHRWLVVFFAAAVDDSKNLGITEYCPFFSVFLISQLQTIMTTDKKCNNDLVFWHIWASIHK